MEVNAGPFHRSPLPSTSDFSPVVPAGVRAGFSKGSARDHAHGEAWVGRCTLSQRYRKWALRRSFIFLPQFLPQRPIPSTNVSWHSADVYTYYEIGTVSAGFFNKKKLVAEKTARARHRRPPHPVAPGGRSRRAPRLPARRHAREGRSVSPPALRRPLRHDAGREGRARPDVRCHRSGAACLHARSHARQRSRHPRRGAEHHVHADEDVPDPPGRESRA